MLCWLSAIEAFNIIILLIAAGFLCLSSIGTEQPIEINCLVSTEAVVCPGQVVTCYCRVIYNNTTGGTIRWHSREYIGLKDLELPSYHSQGYEERSKMNPNTVATLTWKNITSQTLLMGSNLYFKVLSDSAIEKLTITCSSADRNSRNITLFLPRKLLICILL